MSAPTFVRREDLANVSRQNKRQFEAFRDATRRYSHKEDSEWTERFQLAEEILMPRPLQVLKNQILLGASCARNSATKILLCTTDIDACEVCRTYMTATQKARHNSRTLRVHLLCYLDDEGQKKKVPARCTADASTSNINHSCETSCSAGSHETPRQVKRKRFKKKKGERGCSSPANAARS